METLSRLEPSMAAAIVGSLFTLAASLLILAVQSALNARAKKYDERVQLAGDLSRLAHRALASVRRLCALMPVNTLDDIAVQRELADLTEAAGDGLAIQLRAYRLFKSRQVRTAVHRLRDRIEVIVGLVVEERPNGALVVDALQWVTEQMDLALLRIHEEMKISVKSPGGLVFVGFRRVNERDYWELDATYPDPPPWVPSETARAMKREHLRKSGLRADLFDSKVSGGRDGSADG